MVMVRFLKSYMTVDETGHQTYGHPGQEADLDGVQLEDALRAEAVEEIKDPAKKPAKTTA